MKIFPLGTNGFFPSFGRQTASYAIPLGKLLIILDAGSGLFRLAEPEGKKLLEEVSEVHLFLSHYHLDHTFGFYGLFQLLKGIRVEIFGMSKEKFYKELAHGDFFPEVTTKIHKEIFWQDIQKGKYSFGSYEVLVRNQYHNGFGSKAYRFLFAKKSLGYVTDSEPNMESISFISDVDLLLHEHYQTGEDIYLTKSKKIDDQYKFGHTTTVGAALVAKEAGVERLYLIHHYPFFGSRQLKKQEKIAQSIFPSTQLAVDLSEINF